MRNQPVDACTLFRLWHSPATTQEICDKLAISRTRLSFVASKYGLPKRPQERVAPVRADDPTPSQIRERCLAVQATWSESERESRFVGRRRGRVEVMRFAYNHFDCVYKPLS